MPYDNTNRGTLGKNTRRTNDSQPEYTGQININGVDYWLSAWVKEGQGAKFFSLSVKPKDGQQKPSKAPQQSTPDPEDDIPF